MFIFSFPQLRKVRRPAHPRLHLVIRVVDQHLHPKEAAAGVNSWVDERDPAFEILIPGQWKTHRHLHVRLVAEMDASLSTASDSQSRRFSHKRIAVISTCSLLRGPPSKRVAFSSSAQ